MTYVGKYFDLQIGLRVLAGKGIVTMVLSGYSGIASIQVLSCSQCQ